MITNGIQIVNEIGVTGENPISPIYPFERVTDDEINRYTDAGDERIID
jgi:hypothetical protein